MLDRVEADRAEPDRVERRRGDDRLGKDLHQPQDLDELALAAIAHAGFQEPPQMLERFRQCPALQGSRLIKRAGLLLEQRQIVLRVEDELAAAIDARMAGDLVRAADDHDLVDEALHQDVAKAIGGRRRIIVHAIAHQRRRGDLRRALVAGLEGRLGQSAQDRLIRDKPFADRLLVAAGPLGLTGAAAFFQSGVERLEGGGMRHGREEVRPGIFYQGLDFAFVVPLSRSAKTILKQVMADELGEGAGALAFAVAKNARHRDFEIVI